MRSPERDLSRPRGHAPSSLCNPIEVQSTSHLLLTPVLTVTSDSSATIFVRAAVKEFAFLKAAVTLEEAFARGLDTEDGGMIVPLANPAEDPLLAGEVLAWDALIVPPAPRFLALDAVTVWLSAQAEDLSCCLWLILDRFGRRSGIVAVRVSEPGTLHLTAAVGRDRSTLLPAIARLVDWARRTLWPDSIEAAGPPERTRMLASLGFTDIAAGGRRFADPGPTGESMILTAGPSISVRETAYAYDAAKRGWNNRWNGYLSRFEREFADYIGVRHAIATSSCTGALHIALAALGIGPGDEVIVPEITWVATANAVRYVGATPVFADVEPDSWCLDPDSCEAMISPRTRAVIPVHLYGNPARIDRIKEIAARHRLVVVEDAAPSIGATFHGRRTGSFGDFSCFSFQGAKLLVTGEGGMLLTDDEELYRRASKIADQGRVPGTFHIDERGWKYKMSNVQAAVGLGQLQRIDELIAAKRRIYGWYQENLRELASVTFNRPCPGSESIFWMTSLLLEDEAALSRQELREELKRRNIDTRDVFPPISQYPIWENRSTPKPVAARIGARGINLPSGVCLQRSEVDYICRCIRELLAPASRGRAEAAREL